MFMNFLRHLLTISAFLILGATQMQAQDYQSAIGLRLGSPASVSLKTFLGGSNNAIEAFVGFRTNSVGSAFSGTKYRWTWIALGAAYQVHNPLEIEGIEGLSWYYGAGGSVYFWTFNDDAFFADEASVSLGIQGYLGLDYKIKNAPINLSLDWVPTFFINGYVSGFGAGYGALSVRYVFAE